jgi:hypothetical protein
MNTRFNYSDARTIKKLQESTDSGRWILDVPGNGENPVYMNDPQIRPQKWAGNKWDNQVDLESKLWNVDTILSKSRMIHKKPMPDNQPIQYPSSSSLTTEQSRATLPAFLFRELPQQKYAYLPINPQANVCYPFENNISTRILSKDYFVPNVECSII